MLVRLPFSRSKKHQRRGARSAGGRRTRVTRRRLSFDQLESRLLLTSLTITVNSADDDPAGPTAGIVTLRDAIIAVNGDAADINSPDVINFAIVGSPSITLAADLPALANPVLIDGSTQVGVTVNGNAFAMLVDNTAATVNDATFTGGTLTLGSKAVLTVGTGASLSVDGDLHATGSTLYNYGSVSVAGSFIGAASYTEVHNYGTAALSVTGDFTLGRNGFLFNGDSSSAAVTLSVGGSFCIGSNGTVTTYGTSAINVTHDFNLGFASDFYNGVSSTDAATLTVGGSFISDSNFVYNYGASAMHVTGDFTLVSGAGYVHNGASSADAATLTVGGNFISRLVSNEGTSTFTVNGDVTIYGDGYNTFGNLVPEGLTSTDAATFTVGGSFYLGANSAVYVHGTSSLSVAGSFILGANSFFDDYGTLSVGGNFYPASGNPAQNTEIGGTFTAAFGSTVTTNNATWEVLSGGLLYVAGGADFTVAPGGALTVDSGGAVTVDSNGILVVDNSGQINELSGSLVTVNGAQVNLSLIAVNIAYGSALADAQLSGAATYTVAGNTPVVVPGVFSFGSLQGAVLDPGAYSEPVTFTPNDTTTYKGFAAIARVIVPGTATPRATFTVNSAADDPLGPTPGMVTLRDAVNAVNRDLNDNPGRSVSSCNPNNPDVINFAIPGTPVITLSADLPALINPVTIDGSTQAGVTVNGNGHATLVDNAMATVNDVTFAGGAVSVGINASLTVDTGRSLSVAGDLNLATFAAIYNNGSVSVGGNVVGAAESGIYNAEFTDSSVGGNFVGAAESGIYHAEFTDSQTFAATFTVGGAFIAGDDSYLFNNGAATFSVAHDLTLGNDFYLANGSETTDTATITVGGSVSFRADGYLETYGATALNVAGGLTLGDGGFLENGFDHTDSATITVGGSLGVGADAYVGNLGISALRVTHDLILGNDGYLENGLYRTDAATLIVGGSFQGGSDTYVYNEADSVFLVQGNFTLRGDGGEVYSGSSNTDAALFTVGGNFTLGTNSYVSTDGTSDMTVIGNFTLGTNSYFDDGGGMLVGGNFDPGSGVPGYNNTIGGTFVAWPGSAVTTNTSTWEVLAGGLLKVEARASLNLATGGNLQIDSGGKLSVDSGGTFTQGGGTLLSDSHAVTWTWTGHGGDRNWDTAANWNAAPSPNWVGGSTNLYPGQGTVAGENDYVTIGTGVNAATITVRAADTLSVQSLFIATNDTLAITGGTLTVLGQAILQGSLSMTGGTLAVQGSGSTLTATGATTVTGASLLAANGATLSLPNLKRYANEIINNPTNFTANGAGSVLDLPYLEALGTLSSLWTISALNGGDVNLSALALSAHPNISQQVVGSGSQINLAGGTVNISSGASVTIRRGISTGTTYHLSPDARLTVTGGTFGATFNLDAGASITIYGGTFSECTFNLAAGASVNIYGGTFTGTTTWNVSQGAAVSVSDSPFLSGTWAGTGLGTVQLSVSCLYIGIGGLTLNFPGTMLQWTGGFISGAQGNLTNLGTLNLVGSLDKLFTDYGTLDNYGTILQTGTGNLGLASSGAFYTTLKIEAGASYLLASDSGIDLYDGGKTTIENAGTIRKTAGSGTSDLFIAGAITNTGTIESDSGTLFLDAQSISQISGSTLSGGTWNAVNGATLKFPNGTNIISNQSDIGVSGAGATLRGLAGLASNSGSFSLMGGAIFTTAGDFANSGTLTSGLGSTLYVAGNFTQTGTVNEQIGGTPGSGQFGRIAVAQDAALAGAFNLTLVNSFGPSSGQDFPVMSFASVSGNFTSLTGLNPFFTQSLGATRLDLIDGSTNAVDLQLNNVSAPTTAVTGQQVSVNWTVNNPGSQTATGNWQDSVYLSTTPTITGNSILIGAVRHSGGLAAGDSYVGTWAGKLPAVPPGFYYVLVQADSLYQVADPNRVNNTEIATTGQVQVSVPVLTLGTPLHDTFTAANQDHYYQVTVPAGGALQIALTSSAGSGFTALYVGQGFLPTLYRYQQAANVPNQPNQTVTVPQVIGEGTYYVLAHSVSGDAATAGYTLTATQSSGLTVTAISSYAGSNAAGATIEIDGTNFAPDVTASLTLGVTILNATAVNYVSASKIYATFDLFGAAPGFYTVMVQQGTQSATASSPFEVRAPLVGGGPALPSAALITPQFVRSGRTATIVITYSNPNSNDIVAPLLEVDSTNAHVLFSAPDDPNNYVSSIQFLGVAPSGPAGILRPGQSGQLTVTLASNDAVDGDTIPVTVTQIQPGQTIDWASQLSAIKPPSIPTLAWNVVFNNLRAAIGTTTDSYNAALSQAATYLGNLGESPAELGNINRLWSFLIAQADADFPTTTISSTVDASLPTPGNLSLAIDRTFVSSIAGRYTSEIFGLGWETAWKASLSVDAAGNVTIDNGGALSLFVHQANGGYLNTVGKY
ncbi:MAG: hypothetical protein NTY19_07265, partial [Planctomycetota bacterium]|nr:hypothetical protein [Planctomycetota bacterium]